MRRSQVGDDVVWVVVGYRSGPTSTNTVGAVHEHLRRHRAEPLRLDPLSVIIQVLEQGVIGLREERTRDLGQSSEDVSSRRGIFTTEQSRTELTPWIKQIDVVATDKVLCETDNGHVERSVTVVVGGLTHNATDQLVDLHFRVALALEHDVNDLSLTRLETIDDGRNGTNVVGHREEDELFVDEVGIGNLVDVVVKVGAWTELAKPLLTVISLLLVEGKIDQFAVTLLSGVKR